MRLFGLAIALVMLVPVSYSNEIDLMQARASVVRVGADLGNGRFAIGSGIVLAPGEVVTSCHGSHRSRHVSVLLGETSLPALEQRADVNHDLCLLSVRDLTLPPVMLADEVQLKVGQGVYALGHTGGGRRALTYGEIKALYAYDSAHVIRHSAQFSTGASGGGLFDEKGRLVGILTFKASIGDDFHYAVPVAWLNELLKNPPQPATEAFWERDGKDEPWFLRAALLEAQGAWEQLMQVALRWTEAEPTNIEAWVSLARAQLQTDRPFEAQRALACATRIESSHTQLKLLLDATHALENEQLVSALPNTKDLRQEITPVAKDSTSGVCGG